MELTRFDLQNQVIQKRIADALERIAAAVERLANASERLELEEKREEPSQ